MASVGIDEVTGEVITGWERTKLGLKICVTTELGERVQRRDFGAGLGSLIDRPQNQQELLNAYIIIADAIEPRLVDGFWYGEPCFRLRFIRADLTEPGKAVIELIGDEYPNGHLGDFTVVNKNVSAVLSLENVL